MGNRWVVVHAFNPSTWEGEVGGSLWVQGHLGLKKLVPGQVPKLQRNPVLKSQKKKKVAGFTNNAIYTCIKLKTFKT